jgi:hypothetical protein
MAKKGKIIEDEEAQSEEETIKIKSNFIINNNLKEHQQKSTTLTLQKNLKIRIKLPLNLREKYQKTARVR